MKRTLNSSAVQHWLDACSSVQALVFGDVMLDRYIFGDVSRISPEAPVPVLLAQREELRPGGAANVARNMAALGGNAALLSVVGADAEADQLRLLVQQAGVQDLMHSDAALPTTVKTRLLARGQQLLRMDKESTPDPEALHQLTHSFVSAAQEAQVLVLSDYGKGGLQHIQEVIRVARAHDLWVLVDPKGSDYQRYQGAHLITPNRQELRDVVGAWRDEAHLNTKVDALMRQINLSALLLTRSEEGMSLFLPEGRFDVPAQALEVFDVSGAGDTVIASMALLVAAGCSWQDASIMANAAAAVAVSKLGTASVTANEVALMMRNVHPQG